MATEKCVAGSVVQTAVDARLDAVDRVLLGFIPRPERVAIVRDLELRLHSALATSPLQIPTANAADMADPAWDALSSLRTGPAPRCEPVVGRADRWAQTPIARRSKLAVAAAILGIVACAMLLGMPVVYFAMSMVGELLGELLGETGMLLTLATYLLAMLLGGGGAIFLGMTALWSLRRQPPAVGGRGWAVAGLCTGPLPFAIASLLVLCWGLPMLGEMGLLGQPVFAVTAAPESVATTDASAVVQQVSDSQPTCASPAKPTSPSATFVVAEGGSELQGCPGSCSASPNRATPAPTATNIGNVSSPTNSEDRPAPVPNPEPASPSATQTPASD